MIESQNHSPPTHRQFAALVLVLILGAGLRFYRIGVPSLWMDEIVSIELAMGRGTVHDFFPDGVIRTDQPDALSVADAAPIWKIWNRVQITTHPPLYFILLRCWMDVFGNGAGATRLLSAILSVAGILIFFDICRLLHGPRIALLAAIVMALAIGQIDIAREARSYPMLILLSLCAGDLLIRIQFLGPTPRRLVGLSVALSAMLLTHYFAAGAFGALAIYTLLRLRGRQRRQCLAAFFASAVFMILVWGFQCYGQLRTAPSYNPSYLWELLPNHPAQTLLRVWELPTQFLCGEHPGWEIPPVVYIPAAFIVLILPIFRLRRGSALLMWMLWIWGIIGLVALLDLAHDSILLHYTRYTVLASPAAYALIAAFNWPPKSKVRDVVPIAVIASLVILNIVRLRQGVPAKEDFQLLSSIVDAHAAPNELLLFYNDSQWVSPGIWFISYKYYSPQSNHPWATLHHAADANFLRQLNSRSTLWLIGRQPEIDGPKILPGWEPDTYWPTTAGRVCLMRHVVPSNAPSVP